MVSKLLIRTFRMSYTNGGFYLSINCERRMGKYKAASLKIFQVAIYIDDKDPKTPPLEVYSGRNYIPGSPENTYSRLYSPEKIPPIWISTYKYLIQRANSSLALKIVLPSRY